MTTIPATPDCIGPIAISRSLAHQLDELAAGVAADALAPFWVCVTELTHRWSRDSPVRARVIRGRLDAVTTPTHPQPADPTSEPATAPIEDRISFRNAVRLAAAQPPDPHQMAGPVDLTILISVDGERFYLERASTQTDGPGLMRWAQRYLQLLNALADQPDAPEIAHGSPGADEVPVPAAS